jgi:transposase-like protein
MADTLWPVRIGAHPPVDSHDPVVGSVLIAGTNAMESLNARYRRAVKTHCHFQSSRRL